MDLKEKMYFSVKEFSKITNLHPNTVRRSIHNGMISSIRIGEGKNAAFRIPKSELERLELLDLKNIFGIKENINE